MHFLAIINFTAAVQGLFLSYLLVKRTGTKEHRLLASLVAALSITILGAALGLSGYYRQFPHLIRVGDPIVLLVGPLLYGYTSLLTRNALPRLYGWHLVPFGLYVFFLIPFYVSSGSQKIAFVDRVFMHPQPNVEVVLIQTLRTVHVTAYVLISLNLIRRFQRLLKQNFSDIGKLNLSKTSFLLRLFVFISLIRIGVYVAGIYWPINFVLTNNIIGLAISIVIYSLAYSNWHYAALVVAEPNPKPVDEKFRSTYNLSNEQYTLLAQQLEHLLQGKQIYLENELSLAQLSQRLNIAPYQASEVIHRRYGEPFYDLINRHRIEEVKKRMLDPAFSHYSILGIAMDCGFTSKSSFNAAFKKFTELTPSQYRQQMVAA
ncbi:hypothetical protein GCM10023189_51930 [Nibrella saemangeumensis]|uniref:HTH araC/xylS-type domain-containing protein n=1 Tax=Nibrella saemangeumensis TaxID=1084526 RepID=A0ABP8NIS1_9BACT